MPPSLRKHTIILDLDNTLLHTVETRELCETNLDHNEIFDSISDWSDWWCPIANKSYCVFFRPHLKTFLAFCFQRYEKVILWSMGNRNYVELVLSELEKEGYIFHEVWTSDEFPTVKDVVQIKVNRNRTIFVDDIPERIENLTQENIIKAVPFYYQERNDDYLLRLQMDLA